MKVLGVTLARGGSKGVPGKHTRLLGGKPCIAWTIEAALKSKYLDRYVVCSDDAKILKIAREHFAEISHEPPELATDTSPTLPALKWLVDNEEQAWGVGLHFEFDYIIEIRATSPFKTTEDIDAIIKKLIDSGADSVIGVTPLEDHHPARAKWLDERGRIHDFLHEPPSGRRQDLTPKAYIRNGTIYAFKRDVIMRESSVLFGHENSIAHIMPAERSVNIDTELDWKLCELLMAERGSK